MTDTRVERIDHKCDVLVLGAGVIGAACVLRLAQLKPDWTFTLVERASPLNKPQSTNQKVLALGQAAKSILTETGIFSQLPLEGCYPYTNMHVWDESSQGELRFSAKEQGQDALGYMLDADLCAFMLQSCVQSQQNIKCYFEQQPQDLNFDREHAHLHCVDGVISSKLLIAADGVNSWARNRAKIFAAKYPYQQHGVVAKIKSELSHQDTAWQRFLGTGPLAVLPLNDNFSSIVWTVPSALSEELKSLNKEGFEKRLSEAFEYKLGAMTLHSDVQSFPLQSQSAEQYFKANLALIGDAAHCIHPLAGQGANLGFKDVVALTSILKRASLSELSDPALLMRYQRKRKSDNEQTDLLMTALNAAFQNQNSWWQTLRGTGMDAISANSWLKNILARQAMGSG